MEAIGACAHCQARKLRSIPVRHFHREDKKWLKAVCSGR